MKQNRTKIIALIFALFAICSIQTAQAQTKPQMRMVRIEPNTPAPELYADKINFRTTLVNLPGANSDGSSFQVFYDLYFVSEAEFQKSIQNILKDQPSKNGIKVSSSTPTKEDFPVKTLLASGNFIKKNLETIGGRIEEKTAIPFSAKISEKEKTQGAHLITFYTVKIFDAKLSKTIYNEGLFMKMPFVQNDGKNTASDTFYLNFYVNEKGGLYESSLERDKTSDSWGRGDK